MRSLLAVLLISLPAAADVIHLKSGGKIEGRVEVKGDKLEVRTKNGTVTLNRDLVLRIEKKPFDLPDRPKVEKISVRLGSSYANPLLAFKIRLPVGWKRGKNQGSANASFYGAKDGFYQPRIDLRVQKGKIDLAKYVASWKKAIRTGFRDAHFVSDEVSAIGGKTAYQFSAVFTDGEPSLVQQSLFTFVADGDRKYVISFVCTKAWFGKYRDAIDASMRSLRIYPEPILDKEERRRFTTLYSRGISYFRQNQLEKARIDLVAAARMVPEFGELHGVLGAIHLRQGRLSEAEAAFRKGVSLDPQDAGGLYNLGVCLLRQRKYDDAIVPLRRSSDLEPGTASTLTNLGVAYLAKGMDGQARETLEEAVLADPESASSHYNLGLACERLGKRSDAAREYREALKLKPDHSEAGKALRRVSKKK